MKLRVRTQCQYRLQHVLITNLSDELMRRRIASTSMGKLSRLPSSVAYPWRLYDMLIELATANVPILVGAGDNLHETLKSARQYVMEQCGMAFQAVSKTQPVPHIPLRAPTWLHLRVLLAGMIEVNGVRQGGDNWRDNRALVCFHEIGFSLVQLAEGCDACGHCVHSELLQSLGDSYLFYGRQANESNA